MNDEIKEILHNIKECCDIHKDENWVVYQKDKIYQLLDYITNLQQENEYLKMNNPEQNIEHFRIIKENKRKINNLREENKNQAKRNSRQRLANQKQQELILNLQQENKTLQENNQAMQEEMARVWEENERLKNEPLTNKLGRIDSVVANIYRNNKEQEDYKSRCEKASEIIEKEKENMGYAKYDSCLLLIENIIKNGSDSQ